MLMRDYYLIFPSQKLLAHLNELEAQFGNEILVMGLREPLVIYNRNRGLTAVTEPVSKSVFMGGLWEEANEYGAECHRLIESILGSPPYNIATFDMWWEIMQIDEPVELKDLAALSLDALSTLAPTGNPKADNWIEYLRVEERERESRRLGSQTDSQGNDAVDDK